MKVRLFKHRQPKPRHLLPKATRDWLRRAFPPTEGAARMLLVSPRQLMTMVRAARALHKAEQTAPKVRFYAQGPIPFHALPSPSDPEAFAHPPPPIVRPSSQPSA